MCARDAAVGAGAVHAARRGGVDRGARHEGVALPIELGAVLPQNLYQELPRKIRRIYAACISHGVTVNARSPPGKICHIYTVCILREGCLYMHRLGIYIHTPPCKARHIYTVRGDSLWPDSAREGSISVPELWY